MQSLKTLDTAYRAPHSHSGIFKIPKDFVTVLSSIWGSDQGAMIEVSTICVMWDTLLNFETQSLFLTDPVAIL